MLACKKSLREIICFPLKSRIHIQFIEFIQVQKTRAGGIQRGPAVF